MLRAASEVPSLQGTGSRAGSGKGSIYKLALYIDPLDSGSFQGSCRAGTYLNDHPALCGEVADYDRRCEQTYETRVRS